MQPPRVRVRVCVVRVRVRVTAACDRQVWPPQVRAALTAALQDDEHIEVDAAGQENLPSMLGMPLPGQSTGWQPGGRTRDANAAKLAAKRKKVSGGLALPPLAPRPSPLTRLGRCEGCSSTAS